MVSRFVDVFLSSLATLGTRTES
uniref:Uncharacterized protein n=1 Tax=Lepeophtheirus salmonis TaxID=72036 RepID=A0A0K2TM29_LEPSM